MDYRLKACVGALICVFLSSISSAADLGGFEYCVKESPDGNEWKDCGRLALNKEQPHAWFFSFESADEAQDVLPYNSKYYKSLDGIWAFHWAPTPDVRPREFMHAGFDAAGWDSIAVPGNWNVQGIQSDGTLKYGVPIYCNQPVIFKHKVAVDDWRGGVMREPDSTWTTYRYRNEVGSYRREFTVPAGWKGRETYINFDGVDSFFYLWVNGKYVGFSKNSRNTASFNISGYLNPHGENVVAVEVYRNSDGSFLEAQDMFRLPGIFRSVYLTSRPRLEINDLNVMTKADGTVDVTAVLRSFVNKAEKGLSLRYTVYPVELYGDSVEQPVKVVSEKISGKIDREDNREVRSTFRIDSPRQWSSEMPYRYVLIAELINGKERIMDVVSTYFGIREVEIKDTRADDDEYGNAGRYFYLNGKAVKMKGVNRHEHNPSTGHAVTRDQMKHEIMMMKGNNINHVRTSHYSNDPYWYYLCDKYGIMLEDEANIESHEYYYGKASLSHPVEWRDAHVARDMEMVRAHVNHPSIVIWSLGNEAGPGDNFKACYEAIHQFDPSRPVQYERNNAIVDMGSNQYPSVEWVQWAASGDGVGHIKYPFHISEYAHSMGNAGGNLSDIWEAVESSNYICGGAIWDWVDQALWYVNDKGEKFMAYGGDFGDKPNSGMFCMNGINFADLTPKPEMAEVKKVYSNVGVRMLDASEGRIEVFNKNYFTDLSQFVATWRLLKDGAEVENGTLEYDELSNLKPRHKVEVTLPYEYASLDPDSEYFVNIEFKLRDHKPWAQAGFVQAGEQLLVKRPSMPAISNENQRGEYVSVITEGVEPSIESDGWRVVFDNNLGMPKSIKYGFELLDSENPGGLSLMRAPVDNDVDLVREWKRLGLDSLTHKVLKSQVNVTTAGEYQFDYEIESRGVERDTTLVLNTNMKWTVSRDGSIEATMSTTTNMPELILPRLGVQFNLVSELGNLSYYGRGPGNNYNDRCSSAFIGVYETTVDSMYVNFPKPQEMSNRENVRWALLGNGVWGVMFRSTDADGFSFSALRWNERDLAAARHAVDLPASECINVHIDSKMLGLGGNSCGQDITTEPGRVYADGKPFKFIISRACPIDSNSNK